MTTKEIRKALKSGQKVTFNRHISGCMGYERLPVRAVRNRKGQTVVQIIYGQSSPWCLVQPEFDDYVSIDFPPAEPVKFAEEV